MMKDLLVINGVTFPTPEGGLDINYKDKIAEYESEDGHITVDVIREDIKVITVRYNGLLEDAFRALKTALKTVNSVKLYNPATGAIEAVTMRNSGTQTNKKYYKNNISVWDLAFNLEEM